MGKIGRPKKKRSDTVDHVTITVPRILMHCVRASAREEYLSVSAWITSAIRNRVVSKQMEQNAEAGQ
jgi:hypothetical protein